MKNVQKIESEVDDLLKLSEALLSDAVESSSNLGAQRVSELASVAVRGGQLIRRLYTPGSQYQESLTKVLATEAFTTMNGNYFKHISELVGILGGVQHDIRSGLLLDIKRLLQAEIFADFLEMAEHLLDQEYKDASAVLLGAVLEDSLRKIAVAASLSIVGPNGKPQTIDPLNNSLARAGVYGPLIQKQITSWANLRNDAAHGHFKNYDAVQVRQMLLFVQKFCSDYLQ